MNSFVPLDARQSETRTDLGKPNTFVLRMTSEKYNYIHTYRHTFNPRRGRQRCTLWHVMPLFTPTFHNLYCESH
ncbi:hypothetical protein SFRURICE_007778, partial [Spodoptera frugiperda]